MGYYCSYKVGDIINFQEKGLGSALYYYTVFSSLPM
jgi:hypothetical protein